MGDLILQNLRGLTGKKLEKILSDEKRRMFGEQKLLVKKEGRKSLIRKDWRFFSLRQKRSVGPNRGPKRTKIS